MILRALFFDNSEDFGQKGILGQAPGVIPFLVTPLILFFSVSLLYAGSSLRVGLNQNPPKISHADSGQTVGLYTGIRHPQAASKNILESAEKGSVELQLTTEDFNYALLWLVVVVVALVLPTCIYWNRRLVRAEEALQKANERLRDVDQLKTMFIASVSHELRTPLNSIIGFSGILLQNMLGELNEQQRDSLNRIERAGQHLLELITDVIDISKIEAGRIDAHRVDFLLKDLLQEAMENVDSLAAAKGLTMTLSDHGDLVLYTDRKRLLQCLLNLLSNAVKFTESGSVTVTVQECDADVEISVQDTGIGINEKKCSTLFFPFERLDSHLRIKAGGTGLGLYLTKKIVSELLQGQIYLRSQVGEGSVFALRIPKVLELHCPARIDRTNK